MCPILQMPQCTGRAKWVSCGLVITAGPEDCGWLQGEPISLQILQLSRAPTRTVPGTQRVQCTACVLWQGTQDHTPSSLVPSLPCDPSSGACLVTAQVAAPPLGRLSHLSWAARAQPEEEGGGSPPAPPWPQPVLCREGVFSQGPAECPAPRPCREAAPGQQASNPQEALLALEHLKPQRAPCAGRWANAGGELARPPLAAPAGKGLRGPCRPCWPTPSQGMAGGLTQLP